MISSDGTSVAFQNQDATALTYGGLKAWDANHKPLAVRFVAGADEESLAIVGDDREANYPIITDPVAQQAYLKASNAGGDDWFGFPVAGLIEDNGQTYWRVDYLRRKGSGLIYTPQKSTTLQPESFAPLVGAVTVEDIDSEWERVTVDEPCDPDTTPQCFSHVEVTLS